MQGQGVVTGLTSAATIWVVAAIGLTVGGGFYVEALGAGLLVTFVLAALGRLEIYVRRLRRRVTATIRTRVGTLPEEVEVALRAYGIVIENQRVFDHAEDRTFELKLAGPSRQFDVAVGELLRREFILGVSFD
jgi:putative Mg2+ transporter-C (MgtC) family protein